METDGRADGESICPSNHHPAELPTLMAPRLIELCFQTAGPLGNGQQGRMGLPQHVDRMVSL